LQLGNIFIWTHNYYVIGRSAKNHKRLCGKNSGSSKIRDAETCEVSCHAYVVSEDDNGDYETLLPPSTKVDFDERKSENVSKE
jgi:hypothetical protein